jgi:hypothetical protein
LLFLFQMNRAQMLPKVRKLKQELVNLKKKSSESITDYVNRAYHIKVQLMECDEVYNDDLDVINWIICGLDHKVWVGVADLVANVEHASTDIAVLLPLLTNKEAAMEISRERFGPAPTDDKKKSRYGVFNAHRGKGSYSFKGRGRVQYDSRGERRCFECNSPDHLVHECPYRERQHAPSSPHHRGGKGGSNRGGYSQRGAYHNMQAARVSRPDDRQPPPPPKRVRYADSPAPASASASAMKHQSKWRD